MHYGIVDMSLRHIPSVHIGIICRLRYSSVVEIDNGSAPLRNKQESFILHGSCTEVRKHCNADQRIIAAVFDIFHRNPYYQLIPIQRILYLDIEYRSFITGLA